MTAPCSVTGIYQPTWVFWREKGATHTALRSVWGNPAAHLSSPSTSWLRNAISTQKYSILVLLNTWPYSIEVHKEEVALPKLLRSTAGRWGSLFIKSTDRLGALCRLCHKIWKVFTAKYTVLFSWHHFYLLSYANFHYTPYLKRSATALFRYERNCHCFVTYASKSVPTSKQELENHILHLVTKSVKKRVGRANYLQAMSHCDNITLTLSERRLLWGERDHRAQCVQPEPASPFPSSKKRDVGKNAEKCTDLMSPDLSSLTQLLERFWQRMADVYWKLKETQSPALSSSLS